MTLQKQAQNILENIEQDTENLEVWAVGGAVRDEYLDRDWNDIDFTIVGETEQTMKDRGFTKIEAQNFPVYQDSKDNEYALAREENSTGDGYHDFETKTDNVDLIDDLKRRGFTINAMAKRISDGLYEYPVAVEGNRGAHTVRDLDEGIIRHITDAFEEDPVRILRMARFASRFPDFEIHEDTMQHAQENSHKLDLSVENPNVPGERVSDEIIKAMKQCEDPVRFWEVMKKSGALKYTMPDLAEFEDISAGPEEHHGEEDLWTHTMMVIEEIQELDPNNPYKILMALVHDIGKVETRGEQNTGGHDKKGIKLVEELAEDLKLSNKYKEKMKDASRHHMRLINVDIYTENSMTPGKVLNLAHRLFDNKGATLEEMMDLARADNDGRITSYKVDTKCFDRIQERLEIAEEAINKIDAEHVTKKRGKTIDDYSGEAIGQMIEMDRIQYIKDNKDRVTKTAVGKAKEKVKNLF